MDEAGDRPALWEELRFAKKQQCPQSNPYSGPPGLALLDNYLFGFLTCPD
jgi:hypothetical protein